MERKLELMAERQKTEKGNEVTVCWKLLIALSITMHD